MSLKKAVIPIAGLGTRMLPATKAIPKEMLPIVTKPIIQYVVEEAVNAGFKEIILVTHSSKTSVENHFDTSFELEVTLEKRVKRVLLKEIQDLSKLNISIHSVRQGEAKGLGHAILCTKEILGSDPFAVILPDMIIKESNKKSNLSLMKANYEKYEIPSMLLGTAKKEDIEKYGIVTINNKERRKDLYSIESIIEKPKPSEVSSNKFAVGRYIFNSSIFSFLEKVKKDSLMEIQLTQAIADYIGSGEKFDGLKLQGKIYDCGEKLGYIKAIIDFALEDESINKNLTKFLKEIR